MRRSAASRCAKRPNAIQPFVLGRRPNRQNRPLLYRDRDDEEEEEERAIQVCEEPFSRAIAVIVGRVSVRSFQVFEFYLYQKCSFKPSYGHCNILKVSKTSKFELQTRPTFTAIALQNRFLQNLFHDALMGSVANSGWPTILKSTYWVRGADPST